MKGPVLFTEGSAVALTPQKQVVWYLEPSHGICAIENDYSAWGPDKTEASSSTILHTLELTHFHLLLLIFFFFQLIEIILASFYNFEQHRSEYRKRVNLTPQK